MDGVVYRSRIVHEAVVHLDDGDLRSEDGALSIEACRASHWTRHRRRIRGDGSRLEPDDCLALALLGRFEVLRDDQNVGIVGWRRVRRRRGVEAEVTSVGQRSAECEYDHRCSSHEALRQRRAAGLNVTARCDGGRAKPWRSPRNTRFGLTVSPPRAPAARQTAPGPLDGRSTRGVWTPSDEARYSDLGLWCDAAPDRCRAPEIAGSAPLAEHGRRDPGRGCSDFREARLCAGNHESHRGARRRVDRLALRVLPEQGRDPHRADRGAHRGGTGDAPRDDRRARARTARPRGNGPRDRDDDRGAARSGAGPAPRLLRAGAPLTPYPVSGGGGRAASDRLVGALPARTAGDPGP